MTQSGQGHDPQNSAAGPAREGIVLPAGGGDAWAPEQQAAPPAGQPWGQPWGPGRQPAAPQAPAQPEGAPGGPQPYGQHAAQGYPAAQPPAAQQQMPPQQPPHQGFPQPPQGQPQTPPMPAAAPPMPPQAPPQPAPAPQAGPPAAGPLPPAAGRPGPGALPPQNAPYAGQQQPPSGEIVRATRQAGAPLPPAAGDAEATTVLPPIAGGPGSAPLPPQGAAPEPRDAATQMLRAIKPHQAPPAAQPMPQSPPMPGAGTEGSEPTQLIPPVGAAAGAGAPTPPPGAPYGVPPGAPADRPTPAEFDGLFRDGPAGPGAAAAPDATAQLPRFDHQAPPPPYGQQGGPGGPFAPGGAQDQYAPYEDDGPRRRKIPAAAIVGAIVVALATVGLGVGWALSGSSGDDTGQKKKEPGSSTAKSAGDDASKSADDPAAGQAKGLDALLADSNNSRSAVIGAVQNIKSCSNLPAAASDLRSAAGQRNDLVKRLQQLPVDKIPNSAELTAALTTAWQSSAAADNHYAAWADKVGGKGGCDKGHAKGGKEASQGNAASGAATQAKRQAAGLWNPLAQKYGLREHQPEQL
ncbi:hypothetical protein [Streptomyces sp. MspMP-M5]|uniref:hypothetical protein n=1 Tax=unclassified Streptomyces TaxID=2593676 RepID=UPI00131A073F|nr:hypothetical protein [Streptomyces sp. MspMP-M5]MYT33211.1 hypothetical protein [Streptomyces sp. SID8354]